MKLPYTIFRHILSYRDPRYEAALTVGAPSSAAIRNVFTHWPEALGKLAKISEHASCVCWMIDDESAVIFKLRAFKLPHPKPLA